jgi:hypothetical protein
MRFPSDKDNCASYFGWSRTNLSTAGDDDDDNLVRYLPEGFVERTSAVGLLVSQWAPLVEVLGHDVVGRFLSHYGWNHG